MSTVSNKLNTFINSNDLQLNQLAPPQLTTRRVITNILDMGILNSNELIQRELSSTRGYDETLNTVVFTNVITKVQGIARAVLSAADGIFTIGMERSDDETLINNFNSLISPEQLEQKFQEKLLSSAGGAIEEWMRDLLKNIVKDELLAKNEEFLDILHKRIQDTAVFILDMEPEEKDKLDDPSGCHDAVRNFIPPERIKEIVVSKELQDSAEIGNIKVNQLKYITFAQEIKQEVTYSYKINNSVKSFKVQLSVPDYQTALVKIFNEKFAINSKPMFIHAARI
jgi:hypothetical protein